MSEQTTHSIDNLHTAVGYGKFKFELNCLTLEVDIPKHGAYKSGGAKENLEQSFQSELEADVMRLVTARQGPGWKLIESSPVIVITPSTKEEKLLTMLAAQREGKLFITPNSPQENEE